MKKFKSIFVTLFILSTGIVYSQNQGDPIEESGNVYYQHDRLLKPRHLLKIVSTNPEAYREMKIAKSNNDISNIIGSVGGFMVGYPIGTALVGGEFNLTLLVIGAGLVGISVPFYSAYAKRTKKAVDMYNEGLNVSDIRKAESSFVVDNYGFGLRISF